MNNQTGFLAKISWYRTNLSTRFLLLLALTTGTLLAGLLVFAARAYREDKLVYIYDVIDLRVERLSLELHEQLVNAVAKKSKSLTLDASCRSLPLDVLKLPRWPALGEVFAAVCEGKPVLVTAEAGGTHFFSFDPQNFNPNEQAIFAYWTSSFGTFLASTKPVDSSESALAARPIVMEYLASGLTHGLLNVNEGKTIGAFREVPSTNTAVFIEMDVEEAMSPLKRFLKIAFATGSVLILVGLAIGSLVLRSLWKPVHEVGRISAEISRGQYDITIAYKYRDEIAGIFEHLTLMARMLKVREEGLKTLHRNIQTVHEATLKMTLLPTKDEAKDYARKACETNIPEMLQPEATLTESARSFLQTMNTSLDICCQNIDLRAQAASKARIEQELEVATAIQHNLLIKPDRIPGLDTSFWYQSAEQIGGDWYGVFYDESKQRAYFYIGDVTGHGAPSALMTGVLCGAIVSHEITGKDLEPTVHMEQLLHTLTSVLRLTGKGEMGATMLLTCFDLKEKQLYLTGAGHPFPVLVQNGVLKSIFPRGSILGISGSPVFESQTVPFGEGDILVMFTDGLVENEGPEGRTLSTKKVKTLVRDACKNRAEDITARLSQEALSCWDHCIQGDDATILTIAMETT